MKQLEIPFHYEEQRTQRPLDENFFKEFQQGNFSHLHEVHISQQKLVELLLQHPDTEEKLKKDILLHMARNICNLGDEVKEELFGETKKTNDTVRALIKQLWEKEDKAELKKKGREKLRKYNNAHRERYGGKKLKEVGETTEEAKELYKIKKDEHIQSCLKTFFTTNLNEEEKKDVFSKFIDLFGEKDCKKNLRRREDDEQKLNELIEKYF